MGKDRPHEVTEVINTVTVYVTAIRHFHRSKAENIRRFWIENFEKNFFCRSSAHLRLQ